MMEQREKLIELVAKALDAPIERNEKGLWKESKARYFKILRED